MIRKASAADTSAVVSRIIDDVKERYSRLVPSLDRTEELAVQCISAGNSMALIGPTGVLLAVEVPHLVFERKYTSIAVLIANTEQECRDLVVQLLNWVEPRRGSSMVGYASAISTNADEALKNLGFTQEGTMLVKWRYE